ncbi:hypothetical protein RQP46_002090 [Phenoliferia psychrophenolica]
MIVNEIRSFEIEEQHDVMQEVVPWEDLLNCCHTARAFVNPARARLYHTALVDISDNVAFLDLPEDIQEEAGAYYESAVLTSKEQLLEATLALNPHLATYVREIKISYSRDVYPSILLPSLALINLFRACPHIHIFTLYGDLRDNEVDALARVFDVCRPALKHVNLGEATFSTSRERATIFAAVSRLPTLQQLILGIGHDPTTAPAPPSPPQAAITSAILDYDIRTDANVTNLILHSCRSTLSHLRIQNNISITPDSVLPNLSDLSHLTKLEWMFFHGWENEDEPADFESIRLLHSLEQLVHLPLTHINIINSEGGPYAAGIEHLVDDLSFLPPTLKYLRIPLPFPDILIKLLVDDRYIDLKEIELDEEYDENAAAWTPTFEFDPDYNIVQEVVPWDDLLNCCATAKAFVDPARARIYHTVPAPPVISTHPPEAALTSVVLDYNFRTDGNLTDRIITASESTLRHLRIHNDSILTEISALPDLSRLQQLTKLEWSYGYDWDETLVHENRRILESLEQMLHLPLTSLSIINVITEDGYVVEGIEHLVDELSFLPPTLKYLRIPLPFPEVLINVLMDDRFVALKEIELDETFGVNAGAWTPVAIERVKEACAHRGLQLECEGVVI